MPTCEICGRKYRFTAAEEAMDPRPPCQCPAHRSKPIADPVLSAPRVKALVELLLRQAADEAAGEATAHGVSEMAGFLRRRIISLSADAQAALDRYAQEAVKSDPRAKALREAASIVSATPEWKFGYSWIRSEIAEAILALIDKETEA